MSSIHERLKEIDDGSFDELVKQIELKTEDKVEREKLLTETVVCNFIHRCRNSNMENSNSKASAEPQVPITLMNYMEALKAYCEPVLVIQKRLTNTDLNERKSRLSIPQSQLHTSLFLAEQEKEKLEAGRALRITFVEIGNDTVVETELRLKKWHTDYALTEKWNEVKGRNEEKFKGSNGVNAVIQLWSFRHDSRRYFALNLVDEEAQSGDESPSESKGDDCQSHTH